MPAIATTNATLSFQASAPATAFQEGPKGTWTPAGDSKVTAGGVAIVTANCKYYIQAGATVSDSATFTSSQTGQNMQAIPITFTATSQKVTASGSPVLCQGDKGTGSGAFQGTELSPSGSPQPKTMTYTITVTITDAGQMKAEAT